MEFNKNNSLHVVSVVIGFLFLTVLIMFSARWGIADLYANQAKNYLELWQAEKRSSPQSIEEAKVAISAAQSLDPQNPDYLVIEAKILEQEAKTLEAAIKDEALEKATSLYRKALSKRPTWPYDWVNLARTKSKLKQFDEEFSSALKNADKYAPWESGVQIEVIIIGFRNWGQLTVIEQNLVIDSYERALHGSFYFRKLFDLGKKYDQWDYICQKTEQGKNHSRSLEIFCESTR